MTGLCPSGDQGCLPEAAQVHREGHQAPGGANRRGLCVPVAQEPRILCAGELDAASNQCESVRAGAWLLSSHEEQRRPPLQCPLAVQVAREKLVHLGTSIGKMTHSGKFRLTVGCLDLLAQHAKYKVGHPPCCLQSTDSAFRGPCDDANHSVFNLRHRGADQLLNS